MAIGIRQAKPLMVAYRALTSDAKRGLSIGTPDVMCTEKALREAGFGSLLGPHVIPSLPEEKAKIVRRRHGLGRAGANRPVVDGRALFLRLGVRLDVLDLGDDTADITWDLNNREPIPVNMQSAYDLVLDLGSTEHVFCPGSAMLTYYSFLKVGGIAVHEMPLTLPGHGFWQPQPKMIQAFCQVNQYELLHIGTVQRRPDVRPAERLLHAVVRKSRDGVTNVPYDLARR